MYRFLFSNQSGFTAVLLALDSCNYLFPWPARKGCIFSTRIASSFYFADFITLDSSKVFSIFYFSSFCVQAVLLLLNDFTVNIFKATFPSLVRNLLPFIFIE